MPVEPAKSAPPTSAPGPTRARVVIVRDPKCLQPKGGRDRRTLRGMLDRAVARLLGRKTALGAWKGLFTPRDRVAIKVDARGQPTHPAVAEAVAECIVTAGVSPGNIIVWDRATEDLRRAGYAIRTDASKVRCVGTDAFRGRSTVAGYESRIVTSGAIGSRFSVIVSRFATALISVPVLKDHGLAGLAGGLLNLFVGAIHNPNKYQDNHWDPYVADLAMHPWIARKLRLVVVDATCGQYHGGPGKLGRYRWPMGGLLVGVDAVAVDAVSWKLLDRKRQSAGLKPLAADGRGPEYIATAAKRGLGVADVRRIEVVEL